MITDYFMITEKSNRLQVIMITDYDYPNSDMHSLSYRQIHTSVCYYKYSFFPISIVLWNKLPADLVLVSDFDSFKTGVSKINHTGTQP